MKGKHWIFKLSVLVLVIVIVIFVIAGIRNRQASRLVMSAIAESEAQCPRAIDAYTTLRHIRYDETSRTVQYCYDKQQLCRDSFRADMKHAKDTLYVHCRRALRQESDTADLHLMKAVNEAGMRLCFLYQLQPTGERDSFFVSSGELHALLQACAPPTP